MIDYSLQEIAKAVRGELEGPQKSERFKGDVSTDTRHIQAGQCFVALRGPQFDGHRFIEEAIRKGVTLCVAEKASLPSSLELSCDFIWVDNTLQALGRLAAYHRRQLGKKIPVIAVTGSCGKTTTKDLIAHFLATKYKVLKSEGSENNYIGVPKTLLRWKDEEVIVVELGTNRSGEIRHLSKVVNPTHAVITMIGNAHLSGFKNVRGVQEEKMSILESMDENSVLVYNADDKNIKHPDFKKFKKIRVGFTKTYDHYADQLDLMHDGANFMLDGKEKVTSPLLGKHNILNFLLALGVAAELGVTRQAAVKSISSFKAPKGRVRFQEIGEVAWIDDSYNSNPSSLDAAIELFRSYPKTGRKILVIGDMLELGPKASLFHREAGRSIAQYQFDLVLTVGQLAKRFAEEARFFGFASERINEFANSEDAGKFLKTQLKSGDTVLLKGSRGMKMERVMDECNATREVL